MPMKPQADESQSEFLARCVPDLMGPDGKKRPQEQAVAACMSIWRDEKGGEPPPKKQYDDVDPGDLPEPDDDEDEDEFVERCVEQVTGNNSGVSDDDARTACEMQWDDYANYKSGTRRKRGDDDNIIRKTHSGSVVNGLEFVLSDDTIDRMGDIVSTKGWDLRAFIDNPVALFNHNPNFPIGSWKNIRVEGGALRARLVLAPEGTSARHDEIRKLVDAGILRSSSVGFRPIETKPRKSSSGAVAGEHFLKQELVETSLVSIPANPNAMAVAKSLAISPATLNLVFAGQGNMNTILKRRGLTGGKADTSRSGKGSAMSSLAQRIIDLEGRITERKDELEEHLKVVDDTNVSDTQMQKTKDLNVEIAQLTQQREVLLVSEKNLASTGDSGSTRSRALVVAKVGDNNKGGGVKDGEIVIRDHNRERNIFDLIVRGATIGLCAKAWGAQTGQIIERQYSHDGQEAMEQTKFMADLVLRAASAPAMTTVAGWAAELVQQIYTDLMPLLMPNAILTRLAAKGLTLSFGRAGRIIIPTRSRTPTLAGSFVGEGQAIPVRQGAFTSQTLVPKKLACISTWSKEMDDHSIPAIEGLIREAIQEDSSVAVDSVLIDANPATVIRPAGLLNGVTPLTATAITNGALAAILGDIKQVVNALVTATYGNLRTPVWLMNPSDMLSASLITAPNTGIFPFKADIAAGNLAGYPVIDSATVAPKTLILVDAADFVVAGGEAPRFEVSDQASLHMEDTAPLELVAAGSPGVVASPQRSLFQTDSLALRMVMPLNWVQRRAGTVAAVTGVTW